MTPDSPSPSSASGTCGKFAASLSPRRGEYFACVLTASHNGPCLPGGTCFTHGPYIGTAGQTPICPKCPPPSAYIVTETPLPSSASVPSGIYVASRAHHGATWKDLRAQGHAIVASWIDESGIGETADYSDLWIRCVREASTARALVLYITDTDMPLKGAFVEVGAALASGVPVFYAGPAGIFSFDAHPLVTVCGDIAKALDLAALAIRTPPPSIAKSEPADTDAAVLAEAARWFDAVDGSGVRCGGVATFGEMAAAIRRLTAALADAQADRAADRQDADRWLFDATARYDELAERFHADTGRWAPGKDSPTAFGPSDPRERTERFNAWMAEKCRAARETTNG